MDDKCYDLIQNKNLYFKRFKVNPTSDNLNNYIEASKLTSKAFSKKKKEKFREFCSYLNINTPISKVWKYVRAFSNHKQNISNRIMIPENSFFNAFEKLALLSSPKIFLDAESLQALPFNGDNLDSTFMLPSF